MALKAKIAALTEVAESLRNEYAAGSDGAFYLNVSDVDELPAVRGISRKRDELLAEKVALKAKFDGVDLDEIKTMRAELVDLKAGNKGGKNDEKIAELNNTITQMKKAAADEKAAADAATAEIRTEKDRYIRKSEIASVLLKHDGNPNFLEHHLEGRLKVVDGKVVVVDANGNPQVKNSLNETMTLEDIVVDMKGKPEWAPAFKTDAKGGSGAQGSTQSSSPSGTFRRNEPGAFAKNAQALIDGKAKGI